MIRHVPLALLLLAAGSAQAQREADPREALRSGPDAPAVSSQLPPSIPPGNSFQGPEGPLLAPRLTPDAETGDTGAGAPETQSTDHIRGVAPTPELGIGGVQVPGAGRSPPPGHEVLGGPALPGAVRPDDSTGIFTDRDVIPPRPGEGPSLSDVPPVVR
ncbi:hypothetical protein [Falsiroseomonas sp.]|uniref:hypothetical protein n=1 Tax=Falsiroseomonas sp. TaxID=2870721 RepID=UPI00356625F7